MIPFFELEQQVRELEPELRAAMDRVLARAWFVLGEEGRAFEHEFATYLGAACVAGVGSGTSALHLALAAVGVKPGDEVIIPANTCVPTAAGVASAGARPVPADIDPRTCTIDPAAVARAITPKTKAVVPVHLYGHPCDMAPILATARERGVFVIEDCAQAHGAAYKGRKCGTLGDAAAFSFYPTKNLGAFGDAGAVATNDPAVDERVRMLRNYGERERYRHGIEGVNSRLDELQAAVLRAKLPYLDRWNAARRERARAYQQGLAGLPVTLPFEAPWARHNYHLFAVRAPRRDALRAFLAQQGIATLMHYPIPIHLQEAYGSLGYREGAFPRAEQACRETLSLPLYPELPLSAVETVCRAITQFFQG